MLEALLHYHPDPAAAPLRRVGAQPGQGEELEGIDPALRQKPSSWRCFPSAWHFAAWRAVAGPKLLPCFDCTPEFRDEMVLRRRCRHPETAFVEREGELVGLQLGAGGLSRYGRKSSVDPAQSIFIVIVAARVLGPESLAGLIGVSVASVPHYRNGNRVLPEEKLQALQSAIRAATRLLVRI